MDAACPTCHAALVARSTGPAPGQVCPSGHGCALTLPVFRSIVGPDAATAIWVAADTAPPGAATCPFCHHPLHDVTAPPTQAGTAHVSVCRPCVAVWVPAGQDALLPAAAPAAARGAEAPAIAAPDRCEGCGAPWQPDADGACRYCHHRMNVPAQVVVLHDGAGDAEQVAGAQFKFMAELRLGQPFGRPANRPQLAGPPWVYTVGVMLVVLTLLWLRLHA